MRVSVSYEVRSSKSRRLQSSPPLVFTWCLDAYRKSALRAVEWDGQRCFTQIFMWDFVPVVRNAAGKLSSVIWYISMFDSSAAHFCFLSFTTVHLRVPHNKHLKANICLRGCILRNPTSSDCIVKVGPAYKGRAGIYTHLSEPKHTHFSSVLAPCKQCMRVKNYCDSTESYYLVHKAWFVNRSTVFSPIIPERNSEIQNKTVL